MSVALAGGWVMLMFGGVWTGGILIVAVERTHQWERMSLEQYAVDFRRCLRRMDPLMPILGAVCCIGTLVFAINRQGAAATLAWLTLALMTVAILASIFIAEPMNSKFRDIPEGQIPERADYIRTKWRRFHAVRTILAIGALGCASAAVLL